MAGIDIMNQFPNSRMARAAKMGQSRFQSVDGQFTPVGMQANLNVSGAGGTQLTVPSVAGDGRPVTYAVITAVGGPLYVTYDGSVPSATNAAMILAAGQSLPVSGAAMAALKMLGTTAAVGYWS